MFAFLFHGNKSNTNGFNSAALNNTIDELSQERSAGKKIQMLHALEDLIKEQIPIIPLCYPKLENVYRANLNTKLQRKNELRFWDFPYKDFSWKN